MGGSPTPPPPKKKHPLFPSLPSTEYRITYGNKPVWLGYRRNHKGSIPPQRTRKACLVRN